MSVIPASAMWAFIDEYGNPNLSTETPGVSEYFIVAAVLVREGSVAELRDGVEKVRAQFFQAGEMKSKKVGSDRARWARLLAALALLPFRFYGLAVDKTQLDRSSGLQWKKSFYKNLCGRAYSKLMQVYPHLHVRADQHGWPTFMESFSQYIKANHRPTLFDRGTFEFVDGKTDVLVQLADILAGLLARCYDPEMQLSKPEELLAPLAGHALLVDEWPIRYRLRAETGTIPTQEGPDERIARHSITLAEDFVASSEDSRDEDVRARVAVLERLLFERRFAETSRPVATGALLDNLRERDLGDKGETWLRRSVIAPLRDRGILITSSSHGYKLPDRRADLVTFARHAESVCVPMINRVNAACKIVKLATSGDVDVLADSELTEVKRLVDAVENAPPVPDPIEP